MSTNILRNQRLQKINLGKSRFSNIKRNVQIIDKPIIENIDNIPEVEQIMELKEDEKSNSSKKSEKYSI